MSFRHLELDVSAQKSKSKQRMNPAVRDKELPKQLKTVYWCQSPCKVFLCIGSLEENYFDEYHSKV